MKIWGVTGLMGAGKSTAMKLLREKGFETVDADALSRKVVDATTSEGRLMVQMLVGEFGLSILAADSISLDRARMRELISNDPAQRTRLEKLLHPPILRELEVQKKDWQTRGLPVAFVEGTRLVESGQVATLSGCILVHASEPLRRTRVGLRDGLQGEEISLLFRLQNEAVMRSASQVVWQNEGTAQEFEVQVDAFLADQGFSRYR